MRAISFASDPPTAGAPAGVTPLFAPLSPGPWAALTMAPLPSGAVCLEDAAGGIVGWATDRAGHTSERVMPEGRTPAEIAINARAMAEARAMLSLLGVLAAIEPALTAALMIRGHGPDKALSAAADDARRLITRVHAGTRADRAAITPPPPPRDDDASAARARGWVAVRRVAPLAPAWFSLAVAGLLAAPGLNADALLIVADALAEAADGAAIEGRTVLAAQLRELADLPRQRAARAGTGAARCR